MTRRQTSTAVQCQGGEEQGSVPGAAEQVVKVSEAREGTPGLDD